MPKGRPRNPMIATKPHGWLSVEPGVKPTRRLHYFVWNGAIWLSLCQKIMLVAEPDGFLDPLEYKLCTACQKHARSLLREKK